MLGVMAPDGAGKTTLLNGLHADVPLPTKYVYMGLWGAGPFDAVLNRIPGGRTAKKVYRLVRGGILARFYRRMGKVVLMDRVAYDALLAGPGGGPLARISNTLALAVAGLREHPVTAESWVIARQWSAEATEALKPLPEGVVKESLTNFAHAVVERAS